jgi:hypothetical protein
MKNKSQKKQSTSAVEAHEPPYPKGQEQPISLAPGKLFLRTF